MPGAGRVPFVGLTGGIGSGKSTALAALARLGAATLSADAVVHDLLGSAEVREAIVARLGRDVLDAQGEIDRGAVAAWVFEHAEDRSWLEGLLWPRVGARIVEWRAAVADRQPPPVAAVVEVPLLFEAGMESLYDTTIAVVAAEQLRAERAGARGHAAVAGRAARQLSQEEKAARAGHVIHNDGTPEQLEQALSRILDAVAA